MQSETIREIGDAIDFSGRYEDIVLLKETSRCRIYTATRAGKRFLLKASVGDGARRTEELKREYEMMAPLAHPYVVYVFTYESESPVGPCIVMEYVDGVTLGEWLSRKRSMRERHRVFSQLLDAVGYLHGKGLLHNDLSPGNILVTRADSSLKVIDFGFSDDDVHYLGRERGCTRSYASPELLSSLPTDARSDIYSLGVLMRDIFGGRYSMVSLRACRKKPEGRYSSVTALRRAFLHARRLPLYAASLVCAASLAFFACDFVSLKNSMEEVSRLEAQKKSVLDSYKERVDRYYDSEIIPAGERMSGAASYYEALRIWGQIIEDYNRFWKNLLNECPEEFYGDLVDYFSIKYNASFPLLPENR